MINVTYLTPAELCARYNGNLVTGTLANWRSKGKNGPAYTHIGGRVFYRMDDVLEWERTSRYRSTGHKLSA